MFASFAFEHDNLALAIKPWYRVPEDKEDDDNRDTDDFQVCFPVDYGNSNCMPEAPAQSNQQ